jgi:mannitol/fructose-specific phosphotransferase system IIA component (Ntr-type)
MKLREIVIEEAILPNLAATSRDEAIREIIGALVEAGALPQERRAEFERAVITRENRASTGLGHGVAVPHVKHKDIETLRIGIAISRRGIDFNALDRKPVYSVFLLLSPADKPEDHLDAMQTIVENLSHDTFRRFLRQASSVQDVLTLLTEADDKQLVH